MNTHVTEAHTGESALIVLEGRQKEELLCAWQGYRRGELQPALQLTALAYVATVRDGGGDPLVNGEGTLNHQVPHLPVKILLAEGRERVHPGVAARLRLELRHPTVMREGDRFSLEQSGRNVAYGVVAAVDAVAPEELLRERHMGPHRECRLP